MFNYGFGNEIFAVNMYRVRYYFIRFLKYTVVFILCLVFVLSSPLVSIPLLILNFISVDLFILWMLSYLLCFLLFKFIVDVYNHLHEETSPVEEPNSIEDLNISEEANLIETT